MKEKLTFILRFAKPHKWKFIIMLLSVILASGTLMLLPYMIGWLVDEVISSENRRQGTKSRIRQSGYQGLPASG